MRYIKLIGIIIFLNSCASSDKKDFSIEVMTNKMKDDFNKLSDIYFNSNGPINGKMYLEKKFYNEKNILVSQRPCQTSCYKNIESGYELVFDLGSPIHPFYGNIVNLMIENDYSYKIEMECSTDCGDDQIKFDSIKTRCKYGVLYLTDSISDNLKILNGFFNIKIYKDNKFKEIDYTCCFSFSTSIIKNR